MTSPTPEIVTAAQPRHIALIASVLMSVAETKINPLKFCEHKKQKLARLIFKNAPRHRVY